MKDVEKICEFAHCVNLADVEELVGKQAELNMAIAEEGLKHKYGANIGKVLLQTAPNDVRVKARAYAAAASDARMNGCEMPVAIVSGIICDGAKASCAVKISQSVEAGILGYDMYCSGNQFYGGDGIVKKGVENTIRSVGRLAHDGMAETDKEIIDIMLNG